MAKPNPSPQNKPPRFETVAFATGLDRPQAQAAGHILEPLAHPQLGLRRYLYVTEPLAITHGVKVHMIEALFPKAFLALRNLYVSLPGGVGSDLFQDGADLLCLSHLLKRPGLAGCVLVRGGFDLKRVSDWLAQQGDAGGGPFLEIGSDRRRDAALAFRGADPALPGLIRAAQDLYQTGAVLGLPDYSLAGVLGLAQEISA